MGRSDKKKFDISWKLYSLIIFLIASFAIVGFTYAYGGANGTVMGHDAGEVIVNIEGYEVSLQSLADAGFFSYSASSSGSPWASDSEGISYSDGSVGIGTGAVSDAMLAVNGDIIAEGINIDGNFELTAGGDVELESGSAIYYWSVSGPALLTCVSASTVEAGVYSRSGERLEYTDWINNKWYSCDWDLNGVNCGNSAYDGCIVWTRTWTPLVSSSLSRSKSNCNAVDDLYYNYNTGLYLDC